MVYYPYFGIPIVNELLGNASKESDNEKRDAIYQKLH
jgi:ABC-type transport system substrate-binding protein